jgi:hypothetical protein
LNNHDNSVKEQVLSGLLTRDCDQVDLDRGPNDNIRNVPREIDTGSIKIDGSDNDTDGGNADEDTKHEHGNDTDPLQLG